MTRLTVDGVDLKTYAKNVETLASTLRTPARRGANAVTAGRSGVIRTPDKLHEAPVYTWPMWVVGCEDDGTVPTDSSEAIEFRRRVDELSLLLDKDGVLDVRSWQPDGSVRQADCECISALDFTTVGVNPIGRFSVEIQNLNAYWADVNHSTATLAPGERVMPAFDGATAPLDDASLIITGPATNPRVSDYYKATAYVQYNGVVAEGQTLTLSGSEFTLTGSGGLSPQLSDLQVVGMAGRIFRLTPNSTTGGYSAKFTASATSATTSLEITGRRKYLVG
jgi:hypothetical protein